MSEDDQYDWFFFELEAGHTYNFSASTTQGGLRAVLYKNDCNSAPIHATSSYGNGSSSISLDFATLNTDYYYLRIEPIPVFEKATYDLNYRRYPESSLPDRPGMEKDAWDPEDDCYEGRTLLDTPGFALKEHGPHTIGRNTGDCAADPYDWYRVLLGQSIMYKDHTYVFELECTGRKKVDSVDIQHESGGDHHSFSDEGNGHYRLEFDPDYSGYYWIVVQDTSYSPKTEYYLKYKQLD